MDVRFPIALDTQSVQFTIYDTPGTDSSSTAHRRTLEKALKEQTQSILIFVGTPDTLEGEGNRELLGYLKAAEEKNNRTSIDISRSLFVINYSDSTMAREREKIYQREIRDARTNDHTDGTDDGEDGSEASFSIKLGDKKLLFTAANYANVANAVMKGVATDEDKGLMEAGKGLMVNPYSPMAMCYKQNRCATSEIGTNRMREESDAALSEAKDAGDDALALFICSGVYALRNEILLYARKYASAVKAYAIIDSVDKTLNRLRGDAYALQNQNKEDVKKKEVEVSNLKMELDQLIADTYKKFSIPANGTLTKEIATKLNIDAESMSHVLSQVKSYLTKSTKTGFLGKGKRIIMKRVRKEKIEDAVVGIVDDYTETYSSNRKSLLEQTRDQFTKEIKDTINNNGGISAEARKYVLDIKIPEVEVQQEETDFSSLYAKNRELGPKILFFRQTEYLNRESFINDTTSKLKDSLEAITNQCADDYKKQLNLILNAVKGEFSSRLESYSIMVRAAIDDKNAILHLGRQIDGAATDLRSCQDGLNKVIWKEG